MRQRILIIFLLLPLVGKASFIESTMGTAVVNDATAVYNNPAALSLLKNPQLVLLGTEAQFDDEFSGTITQSKTGFTQSGTSNSQTNYFLPSGYFATPFTDKFFMGVAVLGNDFGRDVDQSSILRYVLSNNNMQAVDLIPAVSYKLTDYFSIGAGLNFSEADYLQTPTSGAPTLNIADSQSHNDARADAVGGDAGILLKPTASTLIGLNYRSSMTYKFSGTSTLDNNPTVSSNNYAFTFWTPARAVVSLNQFLSRSFGMISTVQWIQWDKFDKVNVKGIATQIGPNPVIIPSTTIPVYLHNSWVYTVGSFYKINPKWIIRTAASYLESPSDGTHDISNGDNIILGASLGYKINKTLTIDGSYSHAFIQDQPINIQNAANTIDGNNQGSRDSVSLKLTVNV